MLVVKCSSVSYYIVTQKLISVPLFHYLKVQYYRCLLVINQRTDSLGVIDWILVIG